MYWIWYDVLLTLVSGVCICLDRSISQSSCGTSYASVYLLWDSVGFYLPSNVQAAAGPVQSSVCVLSWSVLWSAVAALGWRWRCCWLCRLLWWAAVCGAAGAGGGGCGGAVAGSWEARCRHLRWPMARVAKALTTANSLWLPQRPPADCYPTLYTVLSNLFFEFFSSPIGIHMIFALACCIQKHKLRTTTHLGNLCLPLYHSFWLLLHEFHTVFIQTPFCTSHWWFSSRYLGFLLCW